MRPVTLRLPPEAKAYNSLYANENLDYLTQDLLAVALPTGFFIDVGWFPEHNPAGSYCIRVFFQEWSSQQIPMIVTKNLYEVVQTVERLAERFNATALPTASSVPSPSFSWEVAGGQPTQSFLDHNAITPVELTSSSSSSSNSKAYIYKYQAAA